MWREGWNNPGKNDDVQTRVVAVGVFWTFLSIEWKGPDEGGRGVNNDSAF